MDKKSAPKGTRFVSADGGAGMSPTNPARSWWRPPLEVEGSALWGESLTRSFRLATTPQEYWAWLASRYAGRFGEYVYRDDSGIVVSGRDGGVFRFNLRPTDEGLEVEAVLLDAEEYHDFQSLVSLSIEKFGPRGEPTAEEGAIAAPTTTATTDAADPLAVTPVEAGRGRPGLDPEVLVMRLGRAQQAEEIRRGDPSRPWKQIAADVGWPYGPSPAGVKLLEDARTRLKRLQKSDPENLLERVRAWRKTKETMETP